MNRNIGMGLFFMVTMAVAAGADALDPTSKLPLNGEPWLHSWVECAEGSRAAIEKICETGHVVPGREAALQTCLVANETSLHQVVQRSQGDALPILIASPNLRLMRQVGQALTARGIAGSQKDPDAAIRDWLAAIRLAQSVAWGQNKSAVLIDVMVGIAMQRRPVEQLTQLTRAGLMTPKQARLVLKALETRRKIGLPAVEAIIDHESSLIRGKFEHITAAEVQVDVIAGLKLDPKTPVQPLVEELHRLAPTLGARLKKESEAFASTGKEPAVIRNFHSVEDKLLVVALPNYPVANRRMKERQDAVDALELACRRIAGS